jgi:predicted DNA-binding transcriptional regulator AlpA
MSDRILRRPEVEAITGLARSTIYQRLLQGRFPDRRRQDPQGGVSGRPLITAVRAA